MKIAVASCIAYADCWEPFLKLFQKFWPQCPYEVLFITDKDSPGRAWCTVVSDYAKSQSEPILLLQEDFLLNAPVNAELVEHALNELQNRQAAMVRLYPCPGSDEDYGDPYFGRICKGTRYRVSCQASIWEPSALYAIASRCMTPAEFEITGSLLSNALEPEFLAFKREVQPWPISYYCSAISRGLWEPAALEFCRQHGINVNTSMRGIA